MVDEITDIAQPDNAKLQKVFSHFSKVVSVGEEDLG